VPSLAVRPGWFLIGTALALSAVHATAQAQAPTAASPIPDPVPSESSPCCTIPAGTVIEIVNVDVVGSWRSHSRDAFVIRLAEPIIIDGRTVVPVGVHGVGEVVHAARATVSGLPGELILAARYLEYEGVRITLRGMRGRYPNTATIPGTDFEVLTSARHQAIVAADTLVPVD